MESKILLTEQGGFTSDVNLNVPMEEWFWKSINCPNVIKVSSC
jgi:hypothetical protein